MTQNSPNTLTSPTSPIPNPKRPGYEYLLAYQLGLVIQQLTEQFTRRFLTPKDPNLPNPQFRQTQQMTQAARSNPQNVAEGFTQASLKGYIYLAGIARGSNEELGNDYRNFLLQHGYQIWPMGHPKIREFREFRVKWISQISLNTPTLPNDPEEAANLLYTLCQMEGILLRKLVDSLLAKHKKEGGLTERLYHARKTYRGF